ncbi:MAG TPA: glycosyltransferase family 39 protein [Bacilli bacterium]
MTIRKKVLLLLLLCLLSIPLTASAAENIVQNAGFETDTNGVPAMWAQDNYLQDPAATNFALINAAGHTGNHYVKIENLQANDSKFVQTIQTKPNTVYRLSCWAKGENIGTQAIGANISVLGVVANSNDIKGTQTEWQYLELIGKTGKDQKTLQIAVRLGGYGNLNTGVAYFDDVTVEELAEVPPGKSAVPFYETTAGGGSARHPAFTWLMVLYGIVFALFFLYLIRLLKTAKPAIRRNTALFLLFGAAFVARILAAPSMQGHPIDFADFAAWASRAFSTGLANFYEEGVFTDYPPGYMYVLYIVGFLQHAFALKYASAAHIILVKLPAILGDMLMAAIIYRIGKRVAGETAALALAALAAFNPGVFLNSTLWGQMDSVFALFVVWMAYELTRGRTAVAAVAFAAALLMKPQALMFAPLILFALIRAKNPPGWAKAAASGIAAFILGALPFVVNKPLPFLYEHYRAMLLSYPLTTLNAPNLYALISDNGAADSLKFLGVPYSIWGLIFTLAIVIFVFYLFWKNNPPGTYYFLGFIIAALVFMLKTGMHERYNYMVIPFAALSFLYLRDKRILYLLGGFSLTHFINVTAVLRASLDRTYFLPPHNFSLIAVSLANLALTGWAVKAAWDIYVKKRIRQFAFADDKKAAAAKDANTARRRHFAPPENMPDSITAAMEPVGPEESAKDDAARLKRIDWLLLAALTILYGAIALYHLGSLKDPQTYWHPLNVGESFTVDLGQTRQIGKLQWFGGVGEAGYSVDQSVDGKTWSKAGEINQTYQNVFAWVVTPLQAKARYLRFSVTKTGGYLHEIGIFADKATKPLPIKAVNPGETDVTGGSGGNGESPLALFDEQDTIPRQATYMNSSYFDEIYHARTAWEHLHRVQPYETTHPPLGKIFIAIGIALFGLNGFGWRIIGTLFGVAMVPIMYVFGKRLFKRTDYAFLTSLLFTFDFMHFAQTRIATIDVYGVFFIICMYLFMYRYISMSFYRDGLGKTLIPLALSGLSFGLGAASKWIGIYAGAGLAVLLFASLYQRYREYALAGTLMQTGKFSEQKTAHLTRIVKTFPKNTIKTLLWCLLTFVLAPLAIYTASYIPFMMVPGPNHGISDVVKAQKDMYEYHKNLHATHPFSSPWYEWPTIVKPIWYYDGKGLPPDKASSIVSMGNPAVWWTGSAAFLLMLMVGLRKRDKLAFFIAIGLASQYLPWVGVPRLTFIYHFFASVPFLVLSIVYMIKEYRERAVNQRLAGMVTWSYAALTVLLFAMFYPILSGMVVEKSYIDTFLRWFPQWYFHS